MINYDIIYVKHYFIIVGVLTVLTVLLYCKMTFLYVLSCPKILHVRFKIDYPGSSPLIKQ